MSATTIGYVIMTIALIGLLGFTVSSGRLLIAAQGVPGTYIELGSVAYIVEQEMVTAYRASKTQMATITLSINIPLNINGNQYRLSVSSGSLVAECGNVERTFPLPTLTGVTWSGIFSSGGQYLRVTAENANGNITVEISS